MRRANLQQRLTGLLAAVIVLVLAATLLASLLIARDNAKQRSVDSLKIGARVVNRVLDDRMYQLASAASILVRDYGFIEAVGSNDATTVESVLRNHGVRIGAEMGMVVSLDGRIDASTLAALPAPMQFPDKKLLKEASRNGFATATTLLDSQLYQLIVVPIEAPVQIAWACLGFKIDNKLAVELREITSIDTHFTSVQGASGNAGLLASSAADELRVSLNSQMPAVLAVARPTATINLGDDHSIIRVEKIGDSDVLLLMQTSLDTAMAPFKSLYINIVIIAFLSMVAALFGSWLVARSVTRPLQRLAGAAQQIRDGNYDIDFVVRDKDGQETRDLAESLNRMREGIAAREERILHQARHDPLTGLPNRQYAEDCLGRLLKNPRPRAVLLINLNRFSEINDRFGHERGDEVLVEITNRMRARAGVDDLLSRTGGNEFLVVTELNDEGRLMSVAAEYLEVIAKPVSIGSAEVSLNARVGLALAPKHGHNATTLLRRADLALRGASSQTPQVVYEDGREEAHQRELLLAKDLVEAIDKRRLTLNYQPKINIGSGKVGGVEALARWTHPQHGFIRPDHFIAMAERSGNIGKLTRWVLDAAISQAAVWMRAGLELRMSINLSALDLADHELPDFIENTLHKTGLPPLLLCLEVTESAAMKDVDMAIAALQRLRSIGVNTSIDDFGAGFSSLAQLRRLPLDELKIDKGFVLKLQADTGDAAIVRSTIDLAHNMKLKVTAEGVETREALGLLRDWGCDVAQGFYFSKALEADALVQWLEKQSR